MTQIFTNHIGYDSGDTKQAVYCRKDKETPISFSVVCEKTDTPVYTGTLSECGEVDRWETGYYYTMRFDEVSEEGTYYLTVTDDSGKTVRSYPFKIAKNLLEVSTLSAVGYYFKAQRSTGEYEAADKNLRFQGYREADKMCMADGTTPQVTMVYICHTCVIQIILIRSRQHFRHMHFSK